MVKLGGCTVQRCAPAPVYPAPCASHPDVKPNAPLRRSILHPVPLNPDVKPDAPLGRAGKCAICVSYRGSTSPCPAVGGWEVIAKPNEGEWHGGKRLSERERSLSDWPSGQKAIYPRM